MASMKRTIAVNDSEIESKRQKRALQTQCRDGGWRELSSDSTPLIADNASIPTLHDDDASFDQCCNKMEKDDIARAKNSNDIRSTTNVTEHFNNDCNHNDCSDEGKGKTEKRHRELLHPIFGSCRSVDTYEKINRIGEGTYGIVYRARDKRTGEMVALKRVRMEREKEGMPITSVREIKILMETSRRPHPNIVLLKEVAVDEAADAMFLVFEYVEHDLARLIEYMATPFTVSEIKCLVKQLLEAVRHLHKRWIAHRDLKLSNLLYSNMGDLRLADFGLARLCGKPRDRMTPNVVTLWYRAPEVLLGDRKYGAEIDMWAVGCIMGELLRNKPLLPGSNELEQMKMICNLLGSPSEKIWPGFSSLPNAKKLILPNQPYNNLRDKFTTLSSNGFDLLNRLLTYNPSERITASEALRHPWFEESPYPKAVEMMPSFPTDHDDLLTCGKSPRRDGLAEQQQRAHRGSHSQSHSQHRPSRPHQLHNKQKTHSSGKMKSIGNSKERWGQVFGL